MKKTESTFTFLSQIPRPNIGWNLKIELAENNGFAEYELNKIKKIVEKYGNEFKSQYIRHIGKRVDD